MKKFLMILSIAAMSVVAFACSKGGGGDNPTPPGPVAPTSISITPTTINAAQAGESVEVTITAPARPSVSGLPSWITYTDGTYNSSTYKITIKLNFTANNTYEARTANLKVTAAGAASVTYAVTQAGKTVVPDPTLPDNAAVARTKELGLGWNMGNHLDAIADGVANETCWGNPLATQATFTGVKNAGFTSVRIPVTWMGHIGEGPDYKIEDAWMNRVYEVVGYAETAGLKVILNTHHDEDHGDDHWLNVASAVNSEDKNTEIKKEINAVWTQIANKFKDKGDFLMFESFNELINGSNWTLTSNQQKIADIINGWNQEFVTAVRATGGNNSNRWLGVPGYAASPQYLQYFKMPTDPAGKTMVAFHCYDPYDYTIGDKQLANWGHTGNAYPNGENEIKELFNKLYTDYVAKNIPIYMGEFGCSFRNKADSKAWAFFLYYLEYVVKAAKSYGISAFLWDNGAEGKTGYGKECHCYIDHGTGKYKPNGEEPVKVMVKAWSTTDSKYTLQSVYDSAPQF